MSLAARSSVLAHLGTAPRRQPHSGDSFHHTHQETSMFLFERPLAAVLAALHTSGLLVALDSLFRFGPVG
jgi:hypothetical protein